MDLLNVCARAYPCLSKLSVSLKFRMGLCLAGCHIVAHTQGYHLVCIWSSLVKFHGGVVVLKFDASPHCYAGFVLLACKQMTHSVADVPSQQAVKLVL